MGKQKQEIKTELSSPSSLLSPKAMSVAVAALIDRAAEKGITFNCLTFAGLANEIGELVQFLSDLEKNKNNYPNNTRMQYLFSYSYRLGSVPHWMTTDVQIINGKLHFYLVDALAHSTGFILQMALIQAICPDAQISGTELAIQKDEESCAIFALDLAMALAKNPSLHEQLASIDTTNDDFQKNVEKAFAHKLQNLPEYSSKHTRFLVESLHNQTLMTAFTASNFLDDTQLRQSLLQLKNSKIIPRDQLPKHFGSFFKNSQDKTFNAKDFTRHHGESLETFLAQHQEKQTHYGQEKIRNTAIAKKKIKTKGRGEDKLGLSSEQEFKEILANRHGEHYLSNLQIIKDAMQQLSATDIVECDVIVNKLFQLTTEFKRHLDTSSIEGKKIVPIISILTHILENKTEPSPNKLKEFYTLLNRINHDALNSFKNNEIFKNNTSKTTFNFIGTIFQTKKEPTEEKEAASEAENTPKQTGKHHHY